jgi:hypothetical protein
MTAVQYSVTWWGPAAIEKQENGLEEIKISDFSPFHIPKWIYTTKWMMRWRLTPRGICKLVGQTGIWMAATNYCLVLPPSLYLSSTVQIGMTSNI